MIVAAIIALLSVIAVVILMDQLGLGGGITAAPPDISGMVDNIAPVWAHVAWLNKYLPIDQAVLILGVLVTTWLVLYGARMTIWLLVKSRILGGN